MKKIIFTLIASTGLSISVSPQSAGDYRSVGNGNWNDPTKWETYDGGNWISASAYPGQNPGTGVVTISVSNEIKITESVPHPLASLLVDVFGFLTFSAENAVSLYLYGDMVNYGELKIENQNGAKTHTVFIGRSLTSGALLFDESGCYCLFAVGDFQTVNQDDKLNVTFNTTDANSQIWGPNGISFYDITFNCTGIKVETPISVSGTATFTNGIVIATSKGGCNDAFGCFPYMSGGSLSFADNATALGASNASFVDGTVWKSGDDSFTFPIGDEGVFAPLTISAPAYQKSYAASYTRSSGAALGAISDPGLYSISNCEYWDLYPNYNPNNNSLDITVGWTPVSGCGQSHYITNVSEVTLAQFDDTTHTWTTHGGRGAGTATNGSVTWSGATNFGRLSLGNLGPACGIPSVLTSTNITMNSASVSWSEVTDALNYDVDYKAASTSSWINAVSATESTSVNLAGLTPLVTYDWRVRTHCNSTSSASTPSQFTTLPGCGTPAGLSAINITHSGATLSWSPVTTAVSYDIDIKTPYFWTNVATANATTSLNLSNLSPSSMYYWRVRANCNEGPGLYSQASFTTPARCGTPTGLSTTNISFDNATLRWAPVATAEYYNIDYRPSTVTSWTTAATGITSTSFNLGGLAAFTAYDWRVIASCNGFGGNYAQASFTTTACHDVYENNNTSTQAKAINLGVAASAIISSANDVDWFKVTTPNFSYTNLQVDLMDLPADYDLYVYNKSLKLIGSSVNAGTANEVVIYNSNARKATYYIKVVGKNGAFNTSYCYSLLAQVSSGARSASGKSYPVNEVTDISDKQSLYPNPASEFIHMGFDNMGEGVLKIQILNNVGQLVKLHSVNIKNGYNNIRISVGEISPGMYFLRASKGELTLQRKFVIAR